MKAWHGLAILIVAFVLGALYPAPVNFVKSKIGM